MNFLDELRFQTHHRGDSSPPISLLQSVKLRFRILEGEEQEPDPKGTLYTVVRKRNGQEVECASAIFRLSGAKGVAKRLELELEVKHPPKKAES